MSRGRLAVVVLLVAALAFLAAFVPSIAHGMRDEDAIASSELTLTPSRPRTETDRAAEGEPRAEATPGQADVDPDCYQDGLVCKKSRVADVEGLAKVVAPILSNAGWPSGCFEVRIIGGDAGERDALSITVSGAAGLGPAHCREPGSRGATQQQLGRVAQMLRGLVPAAKNARDLDLLQVTDGADVDVQVSLK